MKDYCMVGVLYGRIDTWSYVTCIGGNKMHQFINDKQAENVLAGLRATGWKEDHKRVGNKEIWKFEP